MSPEMRPKGFGTFEKEAPASHPGGVEILQVASCYTNRDKLHTNVQLGSYAEFNNTKLQRRRHSDSEQDIFKEDRP